MTDRNETFKKAIAHYERDELLKALQLLERLCEEYPSDGSVLQYLGDTQRLLFMVDEAFLNLKAAYQNTSPEKRAFVAGRIGLLASDHRSTFEAEYWFKIATTEAGEFVDWVWVLRGKNLIKMGQIDDGIKVLRKALEYEDCRELDEVYLNLALGERARRNYDEATEYSRLALEKNPSCKTAQKIFDELVAL